VIVKRASTGTGLLAVLALAASVSACGGAEAPAGRVVRVPGDVLTIQQGVDKARRGDLVLVAPGTYRESVRVTRAGITIRGEDRAGVILDGEYTRENGIAVGADGVAVENLTVHGYNANGVLFSGALGRKGDQLAGLGTGDNVLKGFRASHVTAYGNGLYGVYAFGSRFGTIDHVYASGHPDSGIYVGQCKPCDTVVIDSVAENNAIGYYGTNASGGVFVVRSVFRGNRVGMTPNSQKMEKLSPQAETVVAGNLVVDGGNPNSPSVPKGAYGQGIVIGGGTRNTVLRNRVEGNPAAGILVTDLETFGPENNRIEGNVAARNGIDLAYAPKGDAGAAGNCFVGNTFATSSPPSIESVLPCDAGAASAGPFPRPTFTPGPPGADHRTMAAPPAQPSMPDAATAPHRPVPATAPTVDLAAIVVPERS
jgi:Right handed beta helix region